MPEQDNAGIPQNKMLSPIEIHAVSERFDEWYAEEIVLEEEAPAAELEDDEEEAPAAELEDDEEEAPAAELEPPTSIADEGAEQDFHEAMKLVEKMSFITKESSMRILVRAIKREFDVLFDDLHTLEKAGTITTEQLDFIEEKLEIRSLHKLFLMETEIDSAADLSPEDKEEFEKIFTQIKGEASDNETDGANSDDE